jgi:hypothetical protein
MQDRCHEDRRAETARENALTDGELLHQRQIRAESQKNLKAALSEFMTSMHEYAICASRWIRGPSDDSEKSAGEARKSLNASYGLVALLVDDVTLDAATKAVSAATALPATVADGKSTDAATASFVEAKTEFVRRARELLAKYGEA